MPYKVRRLIFSTIWITIMIPAVFTAGVIAGLMARFDDWLHSLDPNWDPMHPLRNQPPPPAVGTPTPERVDTYEHAPAKGVYQGESGLNVRSRPLSDDQRAARRRRPS